MTDEPVAAHTCTNDPQHPCEPCEAAYLRATWAGAAVVRLIPLRAALNFWRIREHLDEGFRIRFYRTRRGVTILSVKAVIDTRG